MHLLDHIYQKRIINFDVSVNFIVLTAYCNLPNGKTQHEVLLYDHQGNLLTQVKIGTAVDRLYEIMPYISPDQNNIVVLPSYQSNESFFMKPEFINISKYKKR
ncbi:MAG: hypothetical protein LWY06_20560 [Firmicutes bacterium]|nr:hypothetical protein [Bacillota bacterium]